MSRQHILPRFSNTEKFTKNTIIINTQMDWYDYAGLDESPIR